MSVEHTENYINSSPQGIKVKTETVAKGAIRIKTEIWIDHLALGTASKLTSELYEQVCKDLREKGFKIDGDL